MREVAGPAGNVSEYVHPVDIVQGVCDEAGWDYERNDADEISITHNGSFVSYHISINWMEDFESLHLACAFDLTVPETRLKEVKELLLLINEQIWIGHFDLWVAEKIVLFRHSHLLPGGDGLLPAQCRYLFQSAVDTCDSYYQAFQFVVWGGSSAKDALASVQFVTEGEA